MKIQDIIFIILLLLLIYKRDPKLFVIAGLGCFAISIPFFSFWVFFTAERLVQYAFGFIFLGIILYMIRFKKENR